MPWEKGQKTLASSWGNDDGERDYKTESSSSWHDQSDGWSGSAEQWQGYSTSWNDASDKCWWSSPWSGHRVDDEKSWHEEDAPWDESTGTWVESWTTWGESTTGSQQREEDAASLRQVDQPHGVMVVVDTSPQIPAEDTVAAVDVEIQREAE